MGGRGLVRRRRGVCDAALPLLATAAVEAREEEEREEGHEGERRTHGVIGNRPVSTSAAVPGGGDSVRK